ncbi:unnamed protein product [Schistocephalus solidus]|uniref:Mate-domain-containing protein n=1 Tax=Schistocephalus solidus TaxID=70667 RepID=A0A183SSF4_SCHSO|nr:unnamed protein product [Schistocephalus solidus]
MPSLLFFKVPVRDILRFVSFPQAKKFDPTQVDLYTGGIFLGCEFGIVALFIWAVGLLAAGQSSTMTGTYAGQYTMEGFLNLRWKQWQRQLLTRSIAVLPTLFVTAYQGIENLTEMNDLLNVLMSLQLPFAIIPLLTFTSSKKIMGSFMNSLSSKITSSTISVAVIGVNMFFVGAFIKARVPHHWAAYLGVAVLVFAYLSFIAYLVWWHAQGRLRPRQPPAPSPISGLLDSVLTPGSGGGGGESVVAAVQGYYHLKLIHAQVTVPAPPVVEHTVDLVEIDGRTADAIF